MHSVIIDGKEYVEKLPEPTVVLHVGDVVEVVGGKAWPIGTRGVVVCQDSVRKMPMGVAFTAKSYFGNDLERKAPTGHGYFVDSYGSCCFSVSSAEKLVLKVVACVKD